jgi:hypothetical protein
VSETSDAEYWYVVNGPDASHRALAAWWDDYRNRYGAGRGPESLDDILDTIDTWKKEKE